MSTAQHLTDLAVGLAKAGHTTTVLASRRDYSRPGVLYPAREKHQGVEVIRVWSFSFGRSSRFARILSALFLNLAFAWRLLWLGRFDRIVAMTSPPLVAWIAVLLTRSSRFIYWIMDVNPDEAIEAGWLRKTSLAARFLNWILKEVLKRSDAVVVLDQFMKDRLTLKGAESVKIQILPPWSHDDDLKVVPHQNNPFREKAGLNGKFVVMYSGNLSLCHPLDILLQAAHSLRDDQDIAFVFIGGGERVGEVLNFKERHSLTNILYFPYQRRADLKYSLSAADLHAVVMGKPYVGIVHPCKIYGILKTGRPFVYIGPEESPIGWLVATDGVGHCVDHGEPEKLVRIIQEEKNLRDERHGRLLPAQQKIAERYSQKFLLPLLIHWIAGES